MSTKEVTIKKPSAMIQTNVKGLSLTQRKLINVLIKTAQDNGNCQEYTIPVSVVKKLCGITMAGNNDLKEQFLDLQNIKIIFNYLGKDNNKIWESNVLLPRVRIESNTGIVQFEFTSFIRKQIIDPSMYAPLNVILIASFQSKHAIVLYEFIRDYLNAPKIPLLTIEKFRNLVGVDDGKYKLFKDLKKRVIDRAIDEINEKSELLCSYDLIKEKGNKYSHIQFFVEKAEKKDQLEFIVVLPETIINSLPEKYQTESIYKILRSYYSTTDDPEFIISNIRYSLANAKKNFSHYLKKSLENDYAKPEREENQKQREIKHRAELIRLKKERDAEKQSNEGEYLYNSLKAQELIKYTDKIRIELKSTGIAQRFINEDLIKMKIIEELLKEKRSAKAGVQERLF